MHFNYNIKVYLHIFNRYRNNYLIIKNIKYEYNLTAITRDN